MWFIESAALWSPVEENVRGEKEDLEELSEAISSRFLRSGPQERRNLWK